MADLSKQLPVEKMDAASYLAEKVRRQGRVASRTVNNNFELGMKRQCQDNVDMRDATEDVLRKLNEVKFVEEEAGDQFSKKTKEKIQKMLRNLLMLNHEQKAYLKIVETYGYEAADKFKSADFEDKNYDESLNKRINEIGKEFAPKTKKSNQKKPYSRQQTPGQNLTMQQPAMMVNPMMQFQPNQMMQPNLMNQMMMSSQMMPNQTMGSFNASGFRNYRPKFYLNYGNFGARRNIDKSKDTCKSCGMIGHWAGDAGCRNNGFPQAAITNDTDILNQFNEALGQ